MKLLISAMLLGVFSFGADISGVWRGTFAPEHSDGTKPAYLMVKQDGAKLTGRIGPSEEKNYEFSNGAIDGDIVTFELFADDMRMKVSMKLKDGKLEGVVNAEKDDGEKMKAVLKFAKE